MPNTSAHAHPIGRQEDQQARRRSRSDGPSIEVLSSRVHGRGVFALRHMAPGERVIEYVGEIISMAEAQRRHPHDPSHPEHTFYFHIDDARVIDGLYGGNASRWINHSCRPNCEPVEENGRIFIQTRRQVWRGEELTFNYGLVSDEPMTDALKAKYACRCGAKKCKGTLLDFSLNQPKTLG
jgi:SET domain-containing protein